MERDTLLAGGALAVVAAALVAAAVVPGAIVRERPDEGPPGHLTVREVLISPGEVRGQTVTLRIDSRLVHRGGPSENVSVELRAIDRDTGMVATSRTVDVGTVSDDREVAVVADLTVERAGGYRIEALVYQDDRRVELARTGIDGLSALEPAYARSPIDFHRFEAGGMPAVEFSIEETAGNRTRLNVTTYLTNTGDAPAGDLRLTLTARQVESSIVADRAEARVGEIGPGRTATTRTTVTVPDGYNYYLDAVLWKEGVVVASARAPAKLDPTETIPANQTRRKVTLSVEDFESERDEPAGTPPERTAGGGPGFGPAAAVVGLLAVALLARVRRWSR